MRLSVYIVLLTLGIVFSSCEKKEDGTVDVSFSTPYLSLVSFNHTVLNLNTDTTGSVQKIDSTTYRITILFHGTAILNSSDMPAQGLVTVFKPNDSASFVQFPFSLQLVNSDTFQFSSPITFTIKNTDVGFMRFQFLITTASGNSSNLVQQFLFVVDTIKPVVALIYPENGDTVAGIVTIYTTATDNIGVASVQLLVNGVITATDNTSPYTFSWNTSSLSGSQTLDVKATDRVGNSTTIPPITVFVIERSINYPPVIQNVTMPDTITLPPHDSLLVNITAKVSDPYGPGDIAEVFFYSLNSTDPQQKFEMSGDGTGDGIYTIIVKIVDTPFVRQTGTFHFEFHAVNNEGASATPITKSLTVQ